MRVDLDDLLADRETDYQRPAITTRCGRRLAYAARDGASVVLVDDFPELDSRCCFLRLRGRRDGDGEVQLKLRGVFRIRRCIAGGWLLQGPAADTPTYWVPVNPTARRLDEELRVLSESGADITELTKYPDALGLSLQLAASQCVDLTVWRLPPQVADELESLSPIEAQRWFLWGSHTPYARPADVYAHVIHGAVYENRYAWPHNRRICSENDAHALYVTLCGLERATGKRIYRLLKRQLLLSVMSRQLPDGGFRHGEWTDRMETHFRFCASAMHLFMDAIAEDDDPAVRNALAKLAAFVSQQTDQLDSGTWFLHDSLELSAAGMKECPFGWLESRALGKSETNMLVLNTHLDTTIGLDRLAETTGDARYKGLVAAANAATRAVLALRPAEWLYRLLFRAVNLTLLPSHRAAALPLPVRAVKRLAWQFLIPRLHRVKTKYPRLVMPGGYIDRAVPLATWAFHYLTINISDLVRYRRRFPEPALDRVIGDAVRMTQTSGVLDRWRELNYERYAIGFWAEALYQLCVDAPDHSYRALLAEAILILEDLRMGLPPSLLGANCEAVPPAHQHGCPSPLDARLRIANLSSARGPEFLVVNASPEAVPLELAGPSAEGARTCQDPSGEPLADARPIIPARSWVLATT